MADRSDKPSTPSEFMRTIRPDVYSDSTKKRDSVVERSQLEYVLDTLTARNETHEFEIFCQKLCERTICPNLKPSTGPEGGGDSKADTETYPVCEDVADCFYIGERAAARERWAFAFSAKKAWIAKVRSDVEGIISTGRDYAHIICVTSQFCRSKKRAEVEDELTLRFGTRVTILDRTWITEKVLEHGNGDLAYRYLHVGSLDSETVLGPEDYSRQQQLAAIEKELKDPPADDTIWSRRVTNALDAAKLSRNLERPRLETDGRFDRAVRMAKRKGTQRQLLEACFERLWTAFWWYDDVELVNDEYEQFAAIVFEDAHVKNLQLLGNIAQLLFNSVVQKYLTKDEVRLNERVDALVARLSAVAAEAESPNSSAEAETILLTIEANMAIVHEDKAALANVWQRMLALLDRVKGLGEFDLENFVRLVEVMGGVAGNDPSYGALIDKVSIFVAERTGESNGAMILLRRARQINFTDSMEMIRILGKAAIRLTKREHYESLIEATQLLAMAYKDVGLNWAARATCIFSSASVFVVAETDHVIPASVLSTLVLMAWTSIELKHIPGTIQAVRLLRYSSSIVPVAGPVLPGLEQVIEQMDFALASRLLGMNDIELAKMVKAPSTLGKLGLPWARASLLYVLGYENELRAEGSIPAEETPEKVLELFESIASLVTGELDAPAIFNELNEERIVSRILGLRVLVLYPSSPVCIPVAETAVGILESALATTSLRYLHPHVEVLTIRVTEVADLATPTLLTEQALGVLHLRWPKDLAIGSFSARDDVRPILSQLVGMAIATAFFVDDTSRVLKDVFDREGGLDRMSLVWSAANSHHRLFGKSFAKLDNLLDQEHPYPMRSPAPRPKPRVEARPARGDLARRVDSATSIADHRKVRVFSVIDTYLWNQAKWIGVAYASEHEIPTMALIFKDEDSAKKIFERWRDRFGEHDLDDEIFVAVVRNIDDAKPSHYNVLITSNLRGGKCEDDDTMGSVVTRLKTMTPASSINIDAFLLAYAKVSRYLLVPGYINDEQPVFMFELAIGKQAISVRNARDIGHHDIEVAGLGLALYKAMFPNDHETPD